MYTKCSFGTWVRGLYSEVAVKKGSTVATTRVICVSFSMCDMFPELVLAFKVVNDDKQDDSQRWVPYGIHKAIYISIILYVDTECSCFCA